MPVSSGSTAAVPVDPVGWIGWGDVHTGIGFRDNVLLSHTDEERSGFVRSGVEATGSRVSLGGLDWYAAMSAAGTRYFTAKTFDRDIQTILLTDFSYRIRHTWKLSLGASGYYFDQIFDSSNTDLQLLPTEVKKSGVSVGPRVRWSPQSWWWIEARGEGKRETFPDGGNNRSIGESRLRLGWRPGARAEFTLTGWARRFHYDRHEQYTASGNLEVDSLLRVNEREAEAALDLTLDSSERWKTATRAGGLRYTDNGSGFLNYRYRQVEQELSWTGEKWMFTCDGRVRRVEFEFQTVGIGVAPPDRIRDEFVTHLRIERKLGRRWTAYAEYTWERNRSNDELASYILNEGLLGLRWNWEK